MITLLVPPEDLHAAEALIADAAFRHLFRARRSAAGERLRLVDGEGRARWAEVLKIDRSTARVGLRGEAPSNEPTHPLNLLVVGPRPTRAAWLVEKATEVGVGAIRLLRSERGPRRYGSGFLERLRRVARAAVEQSHRSRLPAVTGPHELSEIPALVSDCGLRWLLSPSAQPSTPGPAAGPAALAVGPEGGWTQGECRTLAGWGFRAIGLGPRTLRVETAAVVGSALLLLPSRSSAVADAVDTPGGPSLV